MITSQYLVDDQGITIQSRWEIPRVTSIGRRYKALEMLGRCFTLFGDRLNVEREPADKGMSPEVRDALAEIMGETDEDGAPSAVH